LSRDLFLFGFLPALVGIVGVAYSWWAGRNYDRAAALRAREAERVAPSAE
jgi:hypothetical protein